MDTLLKTLYSILASPATTTTVAIIAASITLGIYYVRRKDYKRDAANIILLEIQSAEDNMSEARKTYESARAKDNDQIMFPEKLRLMKTESWTKYKYLFVRDLDSVQWQAVSNFYSNCLHFDEAVEHRDGTFGLNETGIRAGIQANISAYSKELAESLLANPENDPEIAKKNRELTDEIIRKKDIAVNANIGSLAYLYNPDKSFTDAAYYFNLLPNSLINTPIGEVLNRLAGKKKHSFQFWKK